MTLRSLAHRPIEVPMARPMIKHDTWIVGSSDGSFDDENLTCPMKAPMDRVLI
jgi:hypothetical protein